MSVIEAIGDVAAACTTLAFLPQVLRVWRTGQTRDISLTMYVVFVTGVVLWLVYGILIDKWPVMAGNAVTLVLSGSVLVMKIRNG